MSGAKPGGCCCDVVIEVNHFDRQAPPEILDEVNRFVPPPSRADETLRERRGCHREPGSLVKCLSNNHARSQLVIERRWAGVQCMTTTLSGRGQGVARTVLNGLAREAARRGIGRMCLAVMADNEAATALYSSAGFRTTHDYGYFTDEPG